MMKWRYVLILIVSVFCIQAWPERSVARSITPWLYSGAEWKQVEKARKWESEHWYSASELKERLKEIDKRHGARPKVVISKPEWRGPDVMPGQVGTRRRGSSPRASELNPSEPRRDLGRDKPRPGVDAPPLERSAPTSDESKRLQRAAMRDAAKQTRSDADRRFTTPADFLKNFTERYAHHSIKDRMPEFARKEFDRRWDEEIRDRMPPTLQDMMDRMSPQDRGWARSGPQRADVNRPKTNRATVNRPHRPLTDRNQQKAYFAKMGDEEGNRR